METKNFTKDKKTLYSTVVIVVLFLLIIVGLAYYSQDSKKRVSLNVIKLSMVESDSFTLKLDGAKNSKVKWTSANNKIVDVDNNGLITAKSTGNTMIIATYDEIEYKCDVEVKSLKFKVTEYFNLKVNESKKIVVEENSKNDVTFKSEDESIAVVSEKGKVTGKKVGSTKIIVTLNDVERSCNINVEDENQTSSTTSNNTNTNNSVNNTDTSNPLQTTNNNGNSGSSTQSKPNNSTSSSGSHGNSNLNNTPSQPAQQPQQPQQPSQPTQPQVTYSYMGKQAYNWIINQGGSVIYGKAYYGNPETTGIGGSNTGEFMANVQNVGTKNCDYIAVLRDGFIDKTEEAMYVARNIFENADTVIDKINRGQTNFTLNGRTYKIWSDRYGLHVEVSPKITTK